MLTFIVLFLPAVFSLWIYEKLMNKDLPLKKVIYRYSVNVVIINFFCFLIKCYVFNTGANSLLFDGKNMIPVNGFNYLCMALPIAVMVALLEVVLSKKTVLTVEENDEDEKEGR